MPNGDRLGQQGDISAIRGGFGSEGPGLFEKFVLGMNEMLGGIPGQNPPGGPRPDSRGGGGSALDLGSIAGEARRLFTEQGEGSAMQYLGQYQDVLTQDQLKQLTQALAEASVRNPSGMPAGGGIPAPAAQVQSLADRVGIRENKAYPMNRLNDLIAHLPTGQADRQKALDMFNAAGRQPTPELIDFLERKWGNLR